MLAVLPILALGTCVLVLKARVACWREAILGGAVLWGVALVGITEVLSAVHGLTWFWLVAAWLAVLVAGVAFSVRGNSPTRIALSIRPVTRVHVVLLGPLAAMVLVLGAIGVAGPPNTWDSMTYHMARVIHWTQNASLAPYPTHILRQLYLEPGAEFALLHLQILSGGDRLADLVQWASMLGTLIGASVIARDLGAGGRGALCATVFAASIPIGILESTSTQNDYVVAFWLVCAMAMALRITRSSDLAVEWATTVAFGASAGLAVLTKATAYIVILPIVVWVTVGVLRHTGWPGLGRLVVAGVIALALNTGFYARNLMVFGSPVGPLDEGKPAFRYMNDAFTPPLLASNLVRDIGLNFNATPIVAINVRTYNFVRLLHVWLGVDPADPRTTWGEQQFTEQRVALAFDENIASNPMHCLLILLALVFVWPLRRVLSSSAKVYAVVLMSGCVLFAVVLRWQPWHTRLELPFFVLGAPLVGAVVERIASGRLVVPLAVLLLVSMLPWVIYNQSRPLVGPNSILGVSRSDRYFTNQPNVRAAYEGAVDHLAGSGCTQVGFVSTVDGWEYPLWALLDGSVKIEHVGVTNVSAALVGAAQNKFEPCAMFVLGPAASTDSIEAYSRTYRRSWTQLDPLTPLEQVAVLTVDER